MSQTAAAATRVGEIDVGAADSDGTLRLWKARRAVESAEAQLDAHLGSVGRLTSSASSLLGWSVTVSLALAAVISSSASSALGLKGAAASPNALPAYLLWPTVTSLASIILAAVFCVFVLWPNDWMPPGLDPQIVWKNAYGTELEIQEASVIGYLQAIKQNADRLKLLQRWLRAAWVLFPIAPIVGLITYIIQHF